MPTLAEAMAQVLINSKYELSRVNLVEELNVDGASDQAREFVKIMVEVLQNVGSDLAPAVLYRCRASYTGKDEVGQPRTVTQDLPQQLTLDGWLEQLSLRNARYVTVDGAPLFIGAMQSDAAPVFAFGLGEAQA